MELNEILTIAVKAKGSDIHIKAGLPPIVRIDGRMHPIPNAPRLTSEIVSNMAFAMMNEKQREIFKEKWEVDLAYAIPGMGRFRVSAYHQRGTVAMVFRVITMTIPTLESLNLPPVMKKICSEERGLILVTGTTGSGKSSTLAAMIDYINQNRTSNIITVEDPVEFLHRDNKSIISQREVGCDTLSFASALKGALRQDPDVILVGEMRDLETIETAMTAAETGHLVMSTLHTMDAAETVNRIIGVFPPYHQRQVRIQLAGIIRGVVSQRLMPKADGKGRVPAVEVMLGTARIRECIDDENKTREIHDAIAQGYVAYGMQTFDQSLMKLLTSGMISYDEALRQSSNPDDFALKMSGVSSTSDASWEGFENKGNAEEESQSFELERY